VAQETARVLITVKASPEPSATYGDTVCVAGVRLDKSKPEWIRLYPIPYRQLSDPNLFRKFAVIEVDLNPSPKDPRPESRRPVLDSITPVAQPWSIPARGALLEPMAQTMCQLRAGLDKNINGQSLGIVRAATVSRLAITPHPGWSPAQARAILNFTSQPDLLSPDKKLIPLEAPRFEARYEYTCEEDGCKGHKQRILDWELVAFERKLKFQSDAAARVAITTQFFKMICSPERRTHFFVGNFADATKRKNFSVLGMYYPRASSDYGSTLF
jgi:hypothetical protein